jgi:hypothetical protein
LPSASRFGVSLQGLDEELYRERSWLQSRLGSFLFNS